MNMFRKMESLRKKELLLQEINYRIEKLEDQRAEILESIRIEEQSELPILLFQIDETVPAAKSGTDSSWETYYYWENVYYIPDLCKTEKCIVYKINETLPNTLDLRDKFKDYCVPTQAYFKSATDYKENIDQAVLALKTKINQIFATQKINSWEDLREPLQATKFNNPNLNITYNTNEK